MFWKKAVKIRQVKIEDVEKIYELEKEVWGEENAATKEMIKSRIETFSEGQLVALIDEKIVGFVSTEIVNYDFSHPLTWYEVTDNGFIKKSHDLKGDTLYGVTLSVHPQYQNKGIGTKLMIEVGRLLIKYNLKQGILGARIPSYHKYSDKIKVEDYVQLKEEKDGIPPDPELAFYQKLGLKMIKIIPNYFKDPESLNYGVLFVWRNPFYNKWYRKIVAKVFKLLVKKFLVKKYKE